MGTWEALLLIGAYFGITFLSKANAVKHLNFFPGNITGMAFENAVPTAYMTVVVQNTSNVTLQLNSLAGNVFSNGYLVGNIFNFTPVLIPGNSQVELPITIKFQVIGLVNDLIRAWQTGSFQQDLRIEGTANADGIQAPIVLMYKVGG